MIIRKEFKFKGTHIVRDCSSDRCKKSIHSHTYVVEVFFTANGLDNGQMIVDFGLMKGTIKDFIGSFDHAYSMWTKEKPKFKKFITENSERWIEMPVSPSAEMYSLMFFYVIDNIINNTVFNNGENNPKLHSVRVHETKTGFAEAFREDLKWWKWNLSDIHFSEGVAEEWKDTGMWHKLLEKIPFVNPEIKTEY